jgi:bacterioferritin-associated ferredoxin
MIVCLCNGHKDRDIRAKAAEIGSTCPATVYTALSGPPRCGRCLDYAGAMLRTDQPCRVGPVQDGHGRIHVGNIQTGQSHAEPGRSDMGHSDLDPAELSHAALA